MIDFKKVIKAVFYTFMAAMVLTLLYAFFMQGFDRIDEMASYAGITFIALGFLFLVGRMNTRRNDVSWQSMQIRQHMDQQDLKEVDSDDSRNSAAIAWIFIGVGFIFFIVSV